MKRFVLIFLIAVLGSCDSPEDIVIDKEQPAVSIQLPPRNEIYQPGDSVLIKAVLSDNVHLRKGSVHIHDQFLPSPADTVFSYEFFIDSKDFELDTLWVVNDASDKTYRIYIDATDMAENYAVQLRYFHQYH